MSLKISLGPRIRGRALRTLLVVFLAVLARHAAAGTADKRLDVFWIDTEGGAATLLVTPAGESVLVDTGNPGKRDPGRIHKAAEAAGLKRIDHVVITHFHGDHFGGLAELSRLIPIGTVWDHDLLTAPDKERNHRDIPDYKAAQVGGRVVVKPGDKLPLKQQKGTAALAFQFLGATERFVTPKGAKANAAHCADRTSKEPDTSDNKNSIVMLVTFGNFRFFDGGDLTWNTEDELVCPLDRVGQVDVYQVNHHGLAVSNNPVLVKTLSPTVAVVNNGPKKGGTPEALATLKATASIKGIYQMHRNVREKADQNTAPELTANAEEDCSGQHIKLTVDQKGKTYALHVPSTGHEKSYETTKKK